MNTTNQNNEPQSASGDGRRRSSRQVVTFYSYKGGVGRSMAVANVALLLARDHGRRVLVVDWDLEAPGLHRFFNMSDEDLGKGVIDYLDNYKTLIKTPSDKISREDLSIKSYLREVTRYEGGGSLKLLGAGLQQTKSDYVEKVRGFDWGQFYGEWNGSHLIEALRNEFLDLADITLIDSRTGITDVGGVCTVQLPDTVVFVFVFNLQNLAGVAQISEILSAEDNASLKALNRRPELFFLPCRKELTELERLRKWELLAEERLGKFCQTKKILDRYGSVLDYLRKSSVPYVSYFAYGEELAANSKKGPELTEAFEPLIDLLLSDGADQVDSARLNRAIAKRKIITYAATVAIASAVVLGFFFLSTALGNPNWVGLLKGAVAGVLGASLFSLTRSQSIAQEDPWKLNSRYITLSLLGDTVVGCFLGVFMSIFFAPSRYYILAALASGFFWRTFSQTFVKTLSDRSSTPR